MQPDSIPNLYGWWLGDSLTKEAWLDASVNERHLWAVNPGSLSISQTGLNGLPTAFLEEDAFFERRDVLSTPFSLATVFKPSFSKKHPFNGTSSPLFGDGENGLSAIRGAKTKDFRLSISSGGPTLESSEGVSGSFSSVVAVFDGENSSLHINGTENPLKGSGLLKQASLRSLVLGHGLFSGEVAEAISYDRALSSSEISSISSYFISRFSLDADLSAKISSPNRIGKNISVFSVDGLDSEGVISSYDWDFVFPESESPDLFDGTGTVTNTGPSLFFQSKNEEDVYYLKLTATGDTGLKDSQVQGFITSEDANVLTGPIFTAEGSISAVSHAKPAFRAVLRVTEESLTFSASTSSLSADANVERGGAQNLLGTSNVDLSATKETSASTSLFNSTSLSLPAGVNTSSAANISSSASTGLSGEVFKGASSSLNSTSVSLLTGEIVSGGTGTTQSALFSSSTEANMSATEDSTDGSQTFSDGGAGL